MVYFKFEFSLGMSKKNGENEKTPKYDEPMGWDEVNRQVAKARDEARFKTASNYLTAARSLPETSSLSLARDLFMFSFYAMGMPFVDIAYQHHVDLGMIGKAMGHTKISTTLLYIRSLFDPDLATANQELMEGLGL